MATKWADHCTHYTGAAIWFRQNTLSPWIIKVPISFLISCTDLTTTDFWKLGKAINSWCQNAILMCCHFILHCSVFICIWAHVIARGVATGWISVFIPPKKINPSKLLWGKMTPERLLNSFIHPQKLLYPQNKFLATPLVIADFVYLGDRLIFLLCFVLLLWLSCAALMLINRLTDWLVE